MEIPTGPLKFKSNKPPIGLDEFENAFIISSGMGVSGWHNGIPFSSSQDGLCSYNVRFTGRTFPCTAGIGNLDLFYTNDNGTYLSLLETETEATLGKFQKKVKQRN